MRNHFVCRLCDQTTTSIRVTTGRDTWVPEVWLCMPAHGKILSIRLALLDEVKPHYTVSAELTVQQEGPLLRGSQMVIPPPLRRALLDKIHSGQSGDWGFQQQRQQPLTPTPLPALPRQKVGSDLFVCLSISSLSTIFPDSSRLHAPTNQLQQRWWST